jgi:hypothetical protein
MAVTRCFSIYSTILAGFLSIQTAQAEPLTKEIARELIEERVPQQAIVMMVPIVVPDGSGVVTKFWDHVFLHQFDDCWPQGPFPDLQKKSTSGFIDDAAREAGYWVNAQNPNYVFINGLGEKMADRCKRLFNGAWIVLTGGHYYLAQAFILAYTGVFEEFVTEPLSRQSEGHIDFLASFEEGEALKIFRDFAPEVDSFARFAYNDHLGNVIPSHYNQDSKVRMRAHFIEFDQGWKLENIEWLD